MESDLVQFRSLLVNKVDSGYQIPPMVIKDNSDLGQSFARIAMSEKAQEGETEGQKAGRYLDEICNTLGEEANAEVVSTLAETTQLFTTKVKAAWDNITAIRENARTLATEMEKTKSDLVAANEFASSHMNYQNLKSDFPVFAWDGTKAMGSIKTVIAKVNGYVTTNGSEPSEEINSNLFTLVISNMSKYDQVERINVTEESRQAAIDLFKQICQNSPAGNIEKVVDLVTGIAPTNEVSETLSKLQQISYAQVNLVSVVKAFDEAITSLYPVLELITSDQVNPFPANTDTVKANAAKLISVLEIAAYYEYMVRTFRLNTALLLQGGIINGDLEEDFKKAGGTVQMLGEYVRFMYQDDMSKIPSTGVTISGITDGSANVSERVAKDIANVASRVTMALNNAKTSAYRIVMRNYIAKQVQRVDEGASAAEVASRVSRYMDTVVAPICDDIRQYNVNFVDAAMNAIVKIQFPGSFTEHMFTELGAAYLATTEQNGNVTATDVRFANVSVIAKLICTFLVDNVVEFVPQTA